MNDPTTNSTAIAGSSPVPCSPVRPWSGRSIQEILDADTGDSSLIHNLANRGRELEAENARMRRALKESLPWIERTYGAMEKQKPVLVEEIQAAIAIPPPASLKRK